MTFEELIDKRKNWVKSSVENNFDFDSILAGLYNDPSHFIFELLQNAEDEGATEVRFELFDERLDFYHNGKDFDIDDIDGVTGIGINKKRGDLTKIGKFGVGFKSVFAVTETPFIFSGDYKIKIEDFVVPSIIQDGSYSHTLIRLPFNHKTRSCNEVYEMISKKLENINLKTMLFLKNIEEINWEILDIGGQYLREAKAIEGFPNVKRVTLISSNASEEFLVIDKSVCIADKDLKIEVAYKLGLDEKGKEIIVPENDSKLVVYFPTERVTYLNFVIQGPYKTTPNRENIPLDDNQNEIILDKTAELVAESLLIIKDMNLFDTYFLNLLPIDTNNKNIDLIYSTIFEKVKEILLTEELLPTAEGNYASANNVLLAREKELTEMLKSNDTQTLFEKKSWLETSITYDRTRELRNYLINELKILEISWTDFARKISVQFLKEKSDVWLTEFYTRLLEPQYLWKERGSSQGILRTKPIIRLENNDHIAPFNLSGKVQVYLPTDTHSQYKTVKPILIQNDDSLRFLKELGLTKPDLFAEIQEFILPKYQSGNHGKDEDYFINFEKLLNGFETVPSNRLGELKESLSRISFVLSEKNCANESFLRKPNEVYFKTSDLLEYFTNYDSVYFISDELYQKFDKKKIDHFLATLGVVDKPRRISNKSVADLPWDERHQLVGYTGREIYKTDYELEGLEHFLSNLSYLRSFLLWKLLLNQLENLDHWAKGYFFSATLQYEYHGPNSKQTESRFLRLLKDTPWLFDKDNNFVKSSDISFSKLSDQYAKEFSSLDILIKALGFKPEIIEQLPEKEKRILEIVAKYNFTPEDLENLITENQKESSASEKNVWTPTIEPESITGSISESEPEEIITPDLSNQTLPTDSNEDEEPPLGDNENTDEDNEPTTPDRESIGKWGERFVFNSLKTKYQNDTLQETEFGFTVTQFPDDLMEIVWLNKNGNRGKGYDFVKKKNGVESEYIEVKTKTVDSDELIKVTGVQWEFARKLYNEGYGDKYCFYLVKNAGEENAVIKTLRNPIKLWREGKLYAHPVNFKL